MLVGYVIMVIAVLIFKGLAFYLLWNEIVAKVLTLNSITFIQSVCFIVLTSIIIKVKVKVDDK